MQHPFFSFCIPTYNRAEKLSRLLASIQCSVKNIDMSYEIIVSDNASTDSTSDVVSMWISKGLPIYYHCNASNLGVDHNMALSLEYARGTYCWWIGDDDCVLPNALGIFQDILRENPNLVGVVSKIKEGESAQNIIYNDPRDFILKENGFSFGTLILKKIEGLPSLDLEYAFKSSHFYAWYFWNMLGVLASLEKSAQVIISARPFLIWDASPNKWYISKLWKIYYVDMLFLCSSLHHFFDPIKPILQKKMWRFLSGIDTPFNCFFGADSKLNALKAMSTASIPLYYKFRMLLCFFIRIIGFLIKYLGRRLVKLGTLR